MSNSINIEELLRNQETPAWLTDLNGTRAVRGLIYIPLAYDNFQPIEPEKLQWMIQEISEYTSSVTVSLKRISIWRNGNNGFCRELVVTVDAVVTSSEIERFLTDLMERIEPIFQQDEMLTTIENIWKIESSSLPSNRSYGGYVQLGFSNSAE